MTKLLTYSKNLSLQNILFDEYFVEHCNISIIAFNYDGQGNALCQCDGKTHQLEASTVKKIIFGVSKQIIENYLKSIFDPDSQNDLIIKQNGHILFRLLELKKLKKYDILNLAKATLKDLSLLKLETFHYFVPATNHSTPSSGVVCARPLYANTKSNIFHTPECKSFNSITCTTLFNSHSEAVSAGFKPCGRCKP